MDTIKLKLDKKFFLIIIGTIGFYAVFLIVSDFNLIYDKISNFKLSYLPIILSLVVSSWLILFVRWHLLLKKSNIHVPIKKNLKIYLAGFALAFTPIKVGELIKSQILKNKFDVPRKTTAPIVFIERWYNFIGIIAISLIAIRHFDISTYIIFTATGLLAITFLLISSKKVYELFLKWFGKKKFVKKFIPSFEESFDVLKRSTRGKTFFYATFLSVAFWFLESLAVYFIFLSFEINHINYFDVISMYTSSVILGNFSFLPEGIGVMETSLVGFLTLQNVDLSIGLTLVVFIRIFILWIGVTVGFIVLKIIGGLSNSD